jgi:hypothetical protein
VTWVNIVGPEVFISSVATPPEPEGIQ